MTSFWPDFSYKSFKFIVVVVLFLLSNVWIFYFENLFLILTILCVLIGCLNLRCVVIGPSKVIEWAGCARESVGPRDFSENKSVKNYKRPTMRFWLLMIEATSLITSPEMTNLQGHSLFLHSTLLTAVRSEPKTTANH